MNEAKKILHIVKHNIDCDTACELISDEFNPHFLLHGKATELLVLIAQGKLDAQALAIKELELRGVDANGKYLS